MFKKQRNCSPLGLCVHNNEKVTLTLLFGSTLASVVLYYFTLLETEEIEILRRIYCFPKICCDSHHLTQNSTVSAALKFEYLLTLGGLLVSLGNILDQR